MRMKPAEWSSHSGSSPPAQQWDLPAQCPFHQPSLSSEKLDFSTFSKHLKKTEQPSLSNSEALWERMMGDNFWFSPSHWDALNQISKNSVLDLASLSFAASPASMSSGTDWMSTGTRAARAATRATMVYQQSGHQSYARNCGRFPCREGRPTAFQRMYKNEYNSIWSGAFAGIYQWYMWFEGWARHCIPEMLEHTE